MEELSSEETRFCCDELFPLDGELIGSVCEGYVELVLLREDVDCSKVDSLDCVEVAEPNECDGFGRFIALALPTSP